MQTPSLVPPALIERILAALHTQFGIADGAEITLEADPGERRLTPQHTGQAQAACSFGAGTFDRARPAALQAPLTRPACSPTGRSASTG